jgi:penicillin-binding protein 2
VSPAQLKDVGEEGVLPGMIVGQYGVEKSYDRFVRGALGQKTIEVDALGHEIKVVRVREAAAGDDLYLTIDLELQRVAETALGGEAGSIVALDPRNGEILALVSHPAFDPNRLSRGVNAADWDTIINSPKKPLTNRAIQGQYPPGSTFKIVVSAASLETKQVTPGTQVFCRGFMPFGRRIYNDWKRGGHGSVDLHTAMVQSCDVYFYDVGRRVGVDPIAEYAFQLGLGRPTGIELVSEKGGLIPTTAWKSRVLGEPWFPGETLSIAIGQGYVTATPLQMANLVGIVATSGERFQPHLVKAVRDRASARLFDFPPVRLDRPNIAAETYAILRKALRGVVADPHGTGGAARASTIAIGGKTGTSQVVGARPGVATKSLPKEFQDHAWFVAFAPVEAPRIAVAVLVENGGHGGEAAAPKALQVIEAYLNRDRSAAGQQL